MTPFTKITGRAAPLDITNVDTDMIIPKQFLKTIKRTGLGVNAFNDMRYNEDGTEIESFVLNQEPYRNAEILIAGENFGCGSSREHAPWAIADFGIRCIIAPSFADIFYNNCFKNGILPIRLSHQQVDQLMGYAKNPANNFSVDLDVQEINPAGEMIINFNVDSFRKHCLINGLDDIGLTLEKKDAIDAFEEKTKQTQPWLWVNSFFQV